MRIERSPRLVVASPAGENELTSTKAFKRHVFSSQVTVFNRDTGITPKTNWAGVQRWNIGAKLPGGEPWKLTLECQCAAIEPAQLSVYACYPCVTPSRHASRGQISKHLFYSQLAGGQGRN